MIKSFGLFLATYVTTAATAYGLAQTPIPLTVSYVGYVCGRGSGFHPLDGLTICGLFAAFLSAYLLRRFFLPQSRTPLRAGGIWYHWKMATLLMLAGMIVYKALATLTADCSITLSDYSIRHVSSYVIVYSLVNAAIGHLFFDLRQYQFEVEPWRPR